MVKAALLILIPLFYSTCNNAKEAQRGVPNSITTQIGISDTSAYMSMLRGKGVGFVGNQTSYIGEEEHSVDFLQERGINIVRLFSPEHGFRGTEDAGAAIQNGIDSITGLQIVSLYGTKKAPTTEDFKGIDIMVFDIQDVGVRFYTYISTLHYIMESCAEHNTPLIVMDRPNPNAFYIDGPILKDGYESFVGMHHVPIVYGMTIGEYAQMINGEKWLKNGLKCDLHIIPLKNWNHSISIPLTRKPSPNLPDSISVMLYPSMCLFEGTIISEGRGTTIPFQCFGHPNLENMPYTFTPKSITGMSTSPKCKDKLCHGMLLDTCYNMVKRDAHIKLEWLITAYKNYKGKEPFFNNFFEKLSGCAELKKQIENGMTEQEIHLSWQKELQEFKEIRERYLLYK